MFIADRVDVKNLSTSDVHVKRYKHQEVSHEEETHHVHVWNVLSNSSIFHVLDVLKTLLQGKPLAGRSGKENKTRSSKKKTEHFFEREW